MTKFDANWVWFPDRLADVVDDRPLARDGEADPSCPPARLVIQSVDRSLFAEVCLCILEALLVNDAPFATADERAVEGEGRRALDAFVNVVRPAARQLHNCERVERSVSEQLVRECTEGGRNRAVQRLD